MTVVLDELGPEPATHAFVIGVGNFPFRNNQWKGAEELSNVENLPSAADSAKVMCEWLLANRDLFPDKLATIEVLISDPPTTINRYAWTPPKPVDQATGANVFASGTAWLNRIRPGDVAFFYCCGHGASYQYRSVLFLEDLNETELNPWVHLNVGNLARALQRKVGLKCAFMFSDACSEFISKLEFSNPQDCRFFPQPLPFDHDSRENVLLLCASHSPHLAFEGDMLDANDTPIGKAGRFTQVLLKALSESSSRWEGDNWAVASEGLSRDLKPLRRIFFGHWDDRLFEPSIAQSPNEFYPITCPVAPKVPLVVITDPAIEAMNYDLHVSETEQPILPFLESREHRAVTAWALEIPATRKYRYSLAVSDMGDPPPYYSNMFLPIQPIFNQRITIQFTQKSGNQA